MYNRTRVKICGITNLEDALLAAELGADALGFIFYRKSPRYVSPQAAALIIRELPPFVSPVGVFVDEAPETVAAMASEAGICAAQLHGSESPGYCSALALKVIKAIRVKDASDISAIRGYNASAYLLDTFREGVPGGTGQTFDWEIAAEAKTLGRIILSGGLGPGNVREAIGKAGPYAVDACSGLEKAPGKKDHDKLREFMEQAKR